jgi:AcrR family transcriptional regulator
MTDPAPCLRADAVRNREAIIGAARGLFNGRGLDVPLDEVARRAGVGNATLYRRFPTRADLVEAVFVDRMTDYADASEAALADPDPWTGFSTYVMRVLELQAVDRGLADLLVSSAGCPGGALEQQRERGFRSVEELILRAQQAGHLREDFHHTDMVVILMANAGLVERTMDDAPASWRRLAAFVLDGLRAEAAHTRSSSPTEEEMAAAMAAKRCPGR